ncbi:SBBP repeat-containing protein [Deinococcus planocerae]|uniref:SBBP repeat-containing protein n=1 Tax=Deinococcus planocerae TaxID=1737569 RepID=UPI000C7F5028|nr:SBBP repeat-containing protein [Deinococcus planocerae]
MPEERSKHLTPTLSVRHAGLLLLSLALAACSQQASTPAAGALNDMQFEAEAGTIQAFTTPQTVADPRNGGRIINDPNASGGKAVILLGTNDNVRFVVPGSVKAGRYTVSVVGKGEEYKGWPTVDLNDARQRRLAVATLDSATYVNRKFGDFDLKPGQVFNLSFINDLYEGRSRDRNAIVDYLTIEPVEKTPTPPAPPPPTQPSSFVSQFGTAGNDLLRDVAVTATGESYVVGNSPEPIVRKVSAQGTEVWTRQISSDVLVQGVSADPSGNAYVLGTLFGETASGGSDVVLQKYAPDGTLVWTRQFGSAERDLIAGLGVDDSGNVYVVGNSGALLPGQQGYDGPPPLPGSPAPFVRKYTPAGELVWSQQFATAQRDFPNGDGSFREIVASEALDAAVDAGGNVYIAGVTATAFPGSTQTGRRDGFVRKYTSAGQEVWTQQLGAKRPSTGEGGFISNVKIGVDAQGNSYVGGDVTGTLEGSDNVGSGINFLAKFGSSGPVVWSRQFGPSDEERIPGAVTQQITDVAVDPAGNAFVSGITALSLPGQSSAGAQDIFVLKYGANGDLLATRQLGTSSFDTVLGAAAGTNGSVYLAGYTGGAFTSQTNAGMDDALLVKLTP